MPSLARLLVLSASLLLAGCATVPPPPAVTALLQDARFQAPREVIDPQAAFALSEPLKRFVHEELAPRVRASGGRPRALFDALNQRALLRLEYDAVVTRNAAEAYAARSGNCLSLVLLTAAVAKELNLQVRYNRAVIEETWSRSGDLLLLNGHVNISIGLNIDSDTRFDREAWLMVDFLPQQELSGLKTVAVSERTIVAMYFNNRAAEMLAAGRVDAAYWWARAALLHEPSFQPAYNTLAVVYLRHDDARGAEQVLRTLLAREPDHRQALANLVQALAQQGRAQEAGEVQARLASLEKRPPFHHFNLGLAAMREGRWHVARDLFDRELQRDPDYHELHYWAGLASLRLGDTDSARRHFSRALENSTARGSQALYAAKLEALKARQ